MNKRSIINRALPVQVPLAAYRDGCVSHLKSLVERIRRLNVLPLGWLVKAHQSTITLSKTTDAIVMKLFIHYNFEWTIHIDDNEFIFTHYTFPNFDDKEVTI